MMARNRRPPTERHIRVHGGDGDDQWFAIPREVFDQYGDYLHYGDGRWQERLSIEPGAAKKALHEWASFIRLANNGHVVVVKTENAVGKNPDLVLDGTISEVKTPSGSSRNTMSHQVEEAVDQAPFLFIDLMRAGLGFGAARFSISRTARQRLSKFRRITLMSQNGSEEVVFDD